ncbi:MAG: hypothetical protein DRQ55_12150 [Planctomycetota bacterium]|nr:MAG: hypothetical protein DRQ55_12150 [Planctomycetota bacterium]
MLALLGPGALAQDAEVPVEPAPAAPTDGSEPAPPAQDPASEPAPEAPDAADEPDPMDAAPAQDEPVPVEAEPPEPEPEEADSTQAPPTPIDADPTQAEPAPAAPNPNRGIPTQASKRFSAALRRMLATEEQAQSFEQFTLGSQAPDTLKGDRLARWQRVSRDQEDWAQRHSEVTGAPLSVPTAQTVARGLSPLESVVLSRLTRAVEASRDVRRVVSIEREIESFLQTANWGSRDRAVELRDALLERELLWSELARQAEELVSGVLPSEELSSILRTLDEISPETATEESLVERLVTDPALQSKVLGELNALLAAPVDNKLPTESDAELLARLSELHQELMEASGLTETLALTEATQQELSSLRVQLEDRGVNALTPEKRAKAAARKAELLVQQNTLRSTWNNTEPDPKASKLLRTTQNRLIRRRMFDLGMEAALFGHRYDRLLESSHELTTPAHVWAHLKAQGDLISALGEARPAPSALDSLKLETHPLPAGPFDVGPLIEPPSEPEPLPEAEAMPKPEAKTPKPMDAGGRPE